jgi:hypothetical protein
MKKWPVLVAGLAFLLAAPAEKAEAQVMFGPQVTLWDFDELGIGGRVDLGLGDMFGIEEGAFQDLFGSVSGNYLLDTGDVTVLVFDLNVAVPFNVEAAVTPYAGAGINLVRSSFSGFSDTSSGLNLLGGLFFDLGAIPAFAQLAYWTTGAGGLTLSAGVLFGG